MLRIGKVTLLEQDVDLAAGVWASGTFSNTDVTPTPAAAAIASWMNLRWDVEEGNSTRAQNSNQILSKFNLLGANSPFLLSRARESNHHWQIDRRMLAELRHGVAKSCEDDRK
jgi:hypothetical protein